MADKAALPTAPASPTTNAPEAQVAPAKKGAAASKVKKPRVKPTHPRTSEMVNAAILSLKERGGSSLQAIKKYVAATYMVDPEKHASFIKKYLKTAVATGILTQTKGKGASGSFKMSATKSDAPKAKTQSTAPKATSPKKKTAAAASTVAPAKKPRAPKKAATPEETADTTEEKQEKPPKTAAPKSTKAKSPSKAKKAAKAPTSKPKAPKPKKAAAAAAAAPKTVKPAPKKAAAPKKK